MEIPRNPTAFTIAIAMKLPLTSPPCATAESTPRITRPMMSSTTAAPSTIRVSVDLYLKSLKTAAVMPTEVAASVAPKKTYTSIGSPGRKKYVNPMPPATGSTTPTSATTVARPPTSFISWMFSSNPLLKSRRITPTIAPKCKMESVMVDLTKCPRAPCDSATAPTPTPARSWPRTGGCLIFFAALPPR
mgnify:FL=1